MRIKQVKQGERCQRFTFSITGEGMNSVMPLYAPALQRHNEATGVFFPSSSFALSWVITPHVYFTFTKYKLRGIYNLEI